MKRHNKAMEDLAKARDEWNQTRLKELDRIRNLRYKKQESIKDIEQTNRDLMDVETKFQNSEPLLSHFYKPSEEMKEYMNFVKFAATIPVLYGVSALII